MTRRRAAVAVAAAAALSGTVFAPFASAAPAPPWDGWYEVTFHADQKTGSSAAATQREEAYTAWYKFSTGCSSGTCVASVVDGPTPKDNVPKATTFDWNGSQWTRSETWRWDCLLPDRTITFDSASSVTNYTPQPDGSLKGTFGTNIGGGDCQGTVYIPLTAVPSDPGTAETVVT